MSAIKKQTYDFLKDHTVGVISTTDDAAHAWGSAVYYAVDEELCFYFLTHMGSKKYDNSRAQPYAAITVVDNDTQTTVQAAGAITEVALGPTYDTAFAMLARIHPPGEHAWVPPVSKIHDGKTMLLMIVPERLQLAIFSHGHHAAGIHKII